MVDRTKKKETAKEMPVRRTYEAAQITRFRKQPTFSQSGDSAADLGGERLRAWARYLDENHDIAKGIIDNLVNKVVDCGIHPEPMVMQRNGKPADRINKQIRDAWEEWAEHPEVTGEYSMFEAERKACRSWLRDGELLVQLVAGNVSGLTHLGGIPFSIELIESDYLPYMKNDSKAGITHGVRKNAWGRPTSYFLYKEHPGNMGAAAFLQVDQNTKEVSADRLLHVKRTDRIKQTRGITCLHSVIERLDDLKSFEESERVKARVQAAFCAAIVKSIDMASTTNDDGDRTFSMDPGMIFDGLAPGESITNIESTSPTALLKDYRAEMLRAAAAGTESSYSTISRDYNGTYSAQRQELTETMPSYRRIRESFIAQFTRPIYRRFIDMAVMAGKITAPKSISTRDLYAVDFGDVVMPWIDPQKEAKAFETLLASKLDSRESIIRSRGRDPAIVNAQIEADANHPEETKPAENKPASGSPGEPVDQDDDSEAVA